MDELGALTPTKKKEKKIPNHPPPTPYPTPHLWGHPDLLA